MRVALVVSLVLLSACASHKLALAPPPGVDLSGRWRLDEADSDDPLHLIQSQTADPSRATAGSQGQGGGGQGGRGGRQGGRGGAGFGAGAAGGPSIPAVGALGDGLRWPGRDVEIKQIAGVVAITSAGVNQVYQPTSGDKQRFSRHQSTNDGSAGADRDMPARDREGAPSRCGWEDKTLVVQGGDGDDDPAKFEERYSLSEDGRRLIEIIAFKGGRSQGFTMSRVWDRVEVDSPPSSALQ